MSTLFLGAILGGCSGARKGASPHLHVPSPDWRDQVIYFLMTDRFADGDPGNNIQGSGEYSPKDGRLYSGGDFEGIRKRIGYIRGLGATAVWITPPVANVWFDPGLKMGGYHGYWAENFKKLDAHLGSLAEYRSLSMALHKRGMYLIQDIVTNHTGDFFYYDGNYDPGRPRMNFRLKEGIYPRPRPSQYPFSMNDVADAKHREAAVYHWTPKISDYKKKSQRLTYQMSGLDDLNTGNPLVRRALRDSYNHWIKEAGVDGFRIDTAKFVERDFWRDFLHSDDEETPGVEVFARKLGKKDFFTFGEIWENSSPFSEKEDALMAEYLGSSKKPEMDAVLNFPLAQDIRAVFAAGAPPARLEFRLRSLNKYFQGGRAALSFIDNHDMDRFLSGGSEAGLAQALALVFTIPSIPVIYSGTEQGFKETRASMFAGGYGSGGVDHYDRKHPLYRMIRKLAALRKAHAVFRRGRIAPIFGAKAGPGPLAYRVDHGRRRALVVFNSADEEMLLADLNTGLPPGTPLKVLFSRGDKPGNLRVGGNGALSLRLPPRAVLVMDASGAARAVKAVQGRVAISKMVGAPGPSGMTTVLGTSSGVKDVQLVIDGRLSKNIMALMRPEGEWTASFAASSFKDGEHSLLAMAETKSGFALSEPRSFDVDVPFVLSGTVKDPVGDDHGPSGGYLYPLEKGFSGMADIESVSLYRRGKSVRLDIKMANGLSDGWNPVFGFDHVCFNVFIDFPDAVAGGPGATVLPRMNARMKAGADWDFAVFLGGWKVALYSAEGATASSFGAPLQPSPIVKGVKEEGTVRITFDPDSLPGIDSFDGARFYVTTWDYDGMEGTLRPIAPKAADWVFGGGKVDAPRIMDDTALIP